MAKVVYEHLSPNRIGKVHGLGAAVAEFLGDVRYFNEISLPEIELAGSTVFTLLSFHYAGEAGR